VDDNFSRTIERRADRDRRQQPLRALVVGGFRPRRRRARRQEAPRVAAVDWHPAKWFAVAFAILLLSFADSLLTLILLERGAVELNPLMRFVIQDDGRVFALVKLGLTGSSITALIVMSRSRAFGRVPAGLVLYATLAIYTCLVGYELSLLDVWTLAY
jgi:hypothetical protein